MAFLDDKEVGKRLKTKREDTGLSPRKFAMGADVDPSQYSKMEKGVLPVTENTLEKLARKYRLDKTFILYGTIVPHGTEVNVELILRDLKENEIRQQGAINMLTVSLAELVSKQSGKSIAVVSSELQKAISSESDRLLVEWKKK